MGKAGLSVVVQACLYSPQVLGGEAGRRRDNLFSAYGLKRGVLNLGGASRSPGEVLRKRLVAGRLPGDFLTSWGLWGLCCAGTTESRREGPAWLAVSCREDS